MKSTEFSATAPQKRNPLQENKGSSSDKHQAVSSHKGHAPYGVDDPTGHVITRMHAAKPALWAKVQNWD